jgi:hypothetical protein
MHESERRSHTAGAGTRMEARQERIEARMGLMTHSLSGRVEERKADGLS